MRKLCLFCLAMLLSIAVAVTAAAAPAYRFKLAHAQPEGQTNYHLASLKFKELLEKYSNGQATVIIYPGGQLGSDFNVVKKVQNGGVDMEIVAVQLLGAYYPAMDIYSMPFMFPSFPAFVATRHSDFHKTLVADMEKKTGIKVMAFIGFSFRHFTNNKHAITSPASMQDLKMRMNQNKIQIATCEALGASAMAIPSPEVFSALQHGVVDGQDATLNFSTSQKYFEVQKHIALTYHQLSGTCFIMNARKFSRLPKEIQDAIVRANNEMEAWWQDYSIKEEDRLLKQWEEKGCQISRPELKPFQDAVQGVYKQFADTVGGTAAIEKVRDIVAKNK